jgi:two-component system, LytTR family, sensor histidine kinase AlgZ
MSTYQEQSSGKARRSYWVCQVSGWSGLFVFQILATYALRMSSTPPFSRISVGLGLFCIVGLVVSHLLHLLIRSRHWLEMPLRRAWPRLAVALAMATAPLTATSLLAEIYVLHSAHAHDLLRPRVVVALWANYLVIMVLWIALYLAANEFRRRRLAEVNALRLELVAQEAQMRGLRAQLNPHFLFNCLNSLREMIVENPESAQKMVNQLSGLLRYSLQSDHAELVALNEEVQAVKAYLDLEAVRFEERLKVRWNISPVAAAAAVPSMLLQTLVENALKHGVSRREEGSEVVIAAWPQDSLLRLEVINSGSLPQDPSVNGIGLRNARTRLQLLYGEKGSVVLENISGNRVRAAVTLPLTATEAAR